jgi:hypothetical protein
LPFTSFAAATTGQIVWVYLNVELDAEDRLIRTCAECIETKLDNQYCEICHKELPPDWSGIEHKKMVEQYQDDFYVPGEDLDGLDLTLGVEEEAEIQRFLDEQ